MAGERLGLVVLADGQESAMSGVETEVGEPPGAIGRQRLPRAVGQPMQQSPRREVRDDDDIADREVRAAAVLVDPAPDVDPGWTEVLDHAVRFAANEADPAIVLGASLEPGQGVAIGPQTAEGHDPLVNQSIGNGETHEPYGPIWRSLRSRAATTRRSVLLVGHRVDLDAEGRQLEAGDLAVDVLGDDVDLRFELGMVLGHVLGRERLVGEAHVHHRRRVTFGGAQVDEATLGDDVEPLAAEVELLDVLADLAGRGLRPSSAARRGPARRRSGRCWP